MTVDQVYTLIKFVANKNSVGYLGPTDFQTLFNIAQGQVFNDYMDGIKGWTSVGRDGKKFPGNTQPNTDSIAVFKVGPQTVLVNGSGMWLKPPDLIYLDAMYKEDMPSVGKIQRVIRVEEDRIWSTASSVIDPVAENPMYTEYAGSYIIRPNDIGTVTVAYYRSPYDVKWNYTIVDGRPVYNPVGSVDPEWSDDAIYKILMRMCFNLGIRLKDQELVSYANIVNNQGE